MADLHDAVRSLLGSELRYAVLRQRLVELLGGEAHLLLLLEHIGEKRLRARDDIRPLARAEAQAEGERQLPLVKRQIVETHRDEYSEEFVNEAIDWFNAAALNDLLQEIHE